MVLIELGEQFRLRPRATGLAKERRYLVMTLTVATTRTDHDPIEVEAELEPKPPELAALFGAELGQPVVVVALDTRLAVADEKKNAHVQGSITRSVKAASGSSSSTAI